MPYISIISPVYNAEKIIKELVRRIQESVSVITLDFEIILVEDCGNDDSWKVIKEISKINKNVRGIKLSRNFGQHYAITCGIDHARGEWVVVMDCDLQDQPEEIVKLYQKAQEGYQIVLARRVERKDGFYKKYFSKVFYRTLGYLTGSKMDESVSNFGIYNKSVIEAIKSLKESIRYFPTMVKWVGFKSTAIPVIHSKRNQGNSSYDFKKLSNLALDIVLAYSDKPIRFMIKFGLGISILSSIMALTFLLRFLLGGITVQGYSSLIISTCFFSGLILVMLGVVGLYVGKTFEGVKNRPIYIIQYTTE